MDKVDSVYNIKPELLVYGSRCIICEKVHVNVSDEQREKYDITVLGNGAEICDECKDAIAFAKELLKKHTITSS